MIVCVLPVGPTSWFTTPKRRCIGYVVRVEISSSVVSVPMEGLHATSYPPCRCPWWAVYRMVHTHCCISCCCMGLSTHHAAVSALNWLGALLDAPVNRLPPFPDCVPVRLRRCRRTRRWRRSRYYLWALKREVIVRRAVF